MKKIAHMQIHVNTEQMIHSPCGLGGPVQRGTGLMLLTALWL